MSDVFVRIGVAIRKLVIASNVDDTARAEILQLADELQGIKTELAQDETAIHTLEDRVAADEAHGAAVEGRVGDIETGLETLANAQPEPTDEPAPEPAPAPVVETPVAADPSPIEAPAADPAPAPEAPAPAEAAAPETVADPAPEAASVVVEDPAPVEAAPAADPVAEAPADAAPVAEAAPGATA